MSTPPDPIIQLPASDDLVRAFLADLSQSVNSTLQLLVKLLGGSGGTTSVAASANQRCVAFYNVGTIQSYVVSKDTVIVGVFGNHTSWNVSSDATSVWGSGAANKIKDSGVIYMAVAAGAQATEFFVPVRIPVKKGDTISVWQASTGAVLCLLFEA